MPELALNQVWKGKLTDCYYLIIRGPNSFYGLYCKDKELHCQPMHVNDLLEFVSNDPQCFWNSIRNQMPYG